MAGMQHNLNDPKLEIYYALTLTHHGFVDEARQVVDLVDQESLSNPALIYKIAKIYCARLSTAQSQKAAGESRKLAVKAVSAAVRAEFMITELAGSEFNSVRNEKDFQEAIASATASSIGH